MPANSQKLLTFIMASLAAHALLIYNYARPTQKTAQPFSGQQWLSVSLSTTIQSTTNRKAKSPLSVTKKHEPVKESVKHQSIARQNAQGDSIQNPIQTVAHLATQNSLQKPTTHTAKKDFHMQLPIKTNKKTRHSNTDNTHPNAITTRILARQNRLTQQKVQRNFLLGQIQNRLLRYMYYPDRARRRGWEGKVTVSFHIDNKGYLHNIHLSQTSGYALLDNAALIAVRKMNNIPMSQWDEDLTPVALQLPVIYRLTNS